MSTQRFAVTVLDGGRGRLLISVPFDPDTTWTPKATHHIRGTVAGTPVRGVIEEHDGVHGFILGPAWVRDCGVSVGDEVDVLIEPEGPQRADLAEDVAAALAAQPKAATFFDSLAQFYRTGYLRWIDATKRKPELRAQRIATMIDLLSAGVKDYRNPQP